MKRNFIFDLIHHAPPLLKKELVEQIGSENNQIYKYYSNCKEGYYSCNNLNYYEKKELEVLLETYRINAVNFTDSRASYQFYNLKDLYRHIEIANNIIIKVLNLVTELVRADKICMLIISCFLIKYQTILSNII